MAQPPATDDLAKLLLKPEKADFYYLPITKCGSTFMLNLLYYLDHGEKYRDSESIHRMRDDFPKAGSGMGETVKNSPHAFAIIRHPVDRFFSVYFDKIYGHGPNSFPVAQRELEEEYGLDLTRGLDAAGHRRNCNILIEWFDKNLKGQTRFAANPHWKPQSKRLNRFAPLELELLTLDGLSWQLPMLLGDIVPDIAADMAAIKPVNKSTREVAQSDILDDALDLKIKNFYRQDMKTYIQVANRWELRRNPVKPGAIRVISAGDLPFYFLVNLKAGCTYLKNLFYLLDKGRLFDKPLKIHAGHNNAYQDKTPEELRAAVSFFVLRDPVGRFFSLYFDKAYGTGPQSFDWIARTLARNRGFDNSPDISLEQHRQNCLAFLGYLRTKFRTQPLAEVNPHWRPQAVIAHRAMQFGMTPLLLENLDAQLLQIADNRIPGLEAAMQAVRQRNRTHKPFSVAEIITPEIESGIKALYPEDFDLYEQVKTIWDKTGKPPEV